MAREVSEKSVVDSFSRCAKPVMRKYMAPNSCIGAARVTVACLGRFGIACRVIPVKTLVKVPSANLCFAYGATAEEIATASVSKRVFGDGWQEHLVVVTVGERLFIDPTIDAALYQLGFPQSAGDPIFFLPCGGFGSLANHLTCKGTLEDGTGVEFVYVQTDDHTYLATEAWNDDTLTLIAGEIALRMQRAGGGTPSITCPRCQRTSYHPADIVQGFCGFCHDWTTRTTI